MGDYWGSSVSPPSPGTFTAPEPDYLDYSLPVREDLSGFISNAVKSNPIVSQLTGSSIVVDSDSCSLPSVSVFGKDISFDFCSGNIISYLSLIGTFIFICAQIYSLFIMLSI